MQNDTDQNLNTAPSAAPTFERSLAELEAIVHDLEDGQLGLAEALARYEQGIQHLQHCYALLQQAEQKIELLAGVASDGSPITEPFADAAEPPPKTPRKRARPKPHAANDDELSGFGRDIDD